MWGLSQQEPVWPGPVGFHQEALTGGLLVGNSLESKSVQERVGVSGRELILRLVFS